MEEDAWHLLKKHTNARIALGRAGSALPTHELLKFRMAHSLAKDAISAEMDILRLSADLSGIGLPAVCVQSRVADRNDYLRNPNKGRILNIESTAKLESVPGKNADVCIIIADGLSANAVNSHAVRLVSLLAKQLDNWTFSPVVLAKYGRVALSDPIGELLKAQIALILIGERPGLSSPDSMGAYLTYKPKTGNTDEKRNCVSNIQPGGLSYALAAAKLAYLMNQMRMKQISGVQLKDDFTDGYLA